MLHSIGRPSRMAVTCLAALALLLAALGSISTARAAEQASCPEAVKDRVTDLWYTVTRGSDSLVVTSLDDVHQGDLVEAHFTVVDGCEDVHVRINSYTASGVTHGTSLPQKLYDKAEGTFGAGQHVLGPIAIPDCYFQADVVVKAAVGEGEGRALRDATLQGENACTEAPPTPEQEEQGSTGTPPASLPDAAMGMRGGSSPMPMVVFSLVLLVSLALAKARTTAVADSD